MMKTIQGSIRKAKIFLPSVKENAMIGSIECRIQMHVTKPEGRNFEGRRSLTIFRRPVSVEYSGW